MSHQKGTKVGGVWTLEDLRLRCRIDAETGCWNWGLSVSQGAPRVHVTLDGKSCTMRGRAAALALERGTRLPKGFVAYPKMNCTSALCVNPEHCRLGSKKAWGEYVQKTGAYRTAAKVVANRAIAVKLRKLTPEQVDEIRVSNLPHAQLSQRYGIGKTKISMIKLGKTYRSPASSVFTWRPA